MVTDLKKLAYKCALNNAVKHGGKAKESAVIGMIFSLEPKFRKNVQEVIQATKDAVKKVNKMEKDEQIKELERIGKIKSKRKEKKEELEELPEPHKNVVMRFAPSPSGPLHIGHARAAILNYEYTKRYNGKLIIRIEDTDPKKVYPDAYEMIPEDLEWLGVKYDEIVVQSDRIPIYYDIAKEVIKRNGGYICTCEPEKFRNLRDKSIPCPCRNNSVEENLEKWEQMFEMDEGGAVLRIKTDLKHKNPAVREWVAMRIVDAEHPRVGDKYRVFPTMNFAVAVDDHLMGMTHVLRGKDHLANTEKQKYLYKHMEWEPPVFIHYGRVMIEDSQLSTSNIRKKIEKGEYLGWDDPRLGTLRALKRRGIKPEALKKLILEIGIKMADVTVSWEKIYGFNRNIVEKEANRYFFVPNPKKVKIKGLPKNFEGKVVKRPLHPDFHERGYRKLTINKCVYLPTEDISGDGINFRLIDAINVKFEENDVIYHSKSLEDAHKIKAKMIQWLPCDEVIKAKVIMPDASVVKGVVEKNILKEKTNDIVQLERFGFARIDKIDKNEITLYYSHK